MRNRTKLSFPILLALAILAALLWSFAGAKDNLSLPLKDNGKRIARQSPVKRPLPPSALDEIFPSANTPFTIPDGGDGSVAETGSIIDSIIITEDITIEDLDVKVDITHDWVRDLTLILKFVPLEGEPDSVLLLELYPAGFIENMTQTWFADEAGFWILQAAPPMTGSFRPMEPLSKFNGRSAAGVWYMEFRDRWRVNEGTVNEWALEFNHVNMIAGHIRQQNVLSPIPRAEVSIIDIVEINIDTTVIPPDTSYVIDVFDKSITRSDGSFTFPRLAAGPTDIRIIHPYCGTLLIQDYEVVEGAEPVWELSSEQRFLTAHGLAGAYPIPDQSSVTITLDVQDNLPPIEIVDVEVALDLNHTYLGDLSMNLWSGSDTLTDMIVFNPNYSGDNLLDCRFDDEALVTIIEGDAPFTGSWKPTTPLSLFDGNLAEGDWKLKVFDAVEGDTGSVHRVELTLVYNEVGTITGRAVTGTTRLSPVVGAQVTVAGTEITDCTNQLGEFTLMQVRPGVRSLEFSHKTYQNTGTDTISVAFGQTTTRDFNLSSIYGTPTVLQSTHGPIPIIDAFHPTVNDTLLVDSLVTTPTTSSLLVENTGILADVNVILNLQHNYLGDLAIKLYAPGDTIQALIVNQRGESGSFVNTRFDDQSCEKWYESELSDSFIGTWQPQLPLSVFDGLSAAGTWTLEVVDVVPEDTGNFYSWELELLFDETIIGPEPPLIASAEDFTFRGNYPNPFNPSTTFSFDLVRDADVKLILFNVLGQQVETLLDSRLEMGRHSVTFEANDLTSGIYFARLSTPHQADTRKIILLK